MEIDQTAAVLSLVQMFDNRRVDKAVIAAWHDLIGDLDYELACESVRLHRKQSEDWLMPVHIRKNYSLLKEARLRRVGTGRVRDLARALRGPDDSVDIDATPEYRRAISLVATMKVTRETIDAATEAAVRGELTA